MKSAANFLFITLMLMTSCVKEEPIEKTTKEVVENNWEDEYNSGGVLDNTTQISNQLVGTTWVLTKYVTGYSTETPYDTIRFVTNNNYTINGGATRTYQLAIITSSTNYDLTLNYFFPFGGSHYSANVGFYFVEDGVMSNVEFTNKQNTTNKIRAWFVKL
jgi:hypothetical protein